MDSKVASDEQGMELLKATPKTDSKKESNSEDSRAEMCEVLPTRKLIQMTTLLPDIRFHISVFQF